jgi:hypothetical protein
MRRVTRSTTFAVPRHSRRVRRPSSATCRRETKHGPATIRLGSRQHAPRDIAMNRQTLTRGALMIAGVLLVGLGFVASYVGALHEPKFHGVALAVVGPTRLAKRLDASGEFTTTSVTSPKRRSSESTSARPSGRSSPDRGASTCSSRRQRVTPSRQLWRRTFRQRCGPRRVRASESV